ncbi:uncharacterized protein LOC126816400 [Patella vulgata]|uniref:uncharacterized protein LOC126816400 n=1 Tax=Patella vulgata TaxID=6465 RepID=UPI00218009CC|nr:uncharacterized protein LOC126816400 [Patella vulgata]
MMNLRKSTSSYVMPRVRRLSSYHGYQKQNPVVKKEKAHVWQSVHWADSFPDETFTMDSTDITPHYSTNKILTLVETKRFEECARFISRLNTDIVKTILVELPISHLHLHVPQSLNVLDAIYTQVQQACLTSFPLQQLRTDELLKNMVILFSRPPNSNNQDKNCNMYFPYCRNILKIITVAEPQFYKMVRQKKQNIDQCLKNLGKHGMVNSVSGRSNSKMISLHDALKVEFERVISLYKTALQKLLEFSLSAKNPSESSVNSGPAPSEASHQRMLQVHKEDIQDRLIKNKTVFNVVEPAVMNQALKNLMQILEKRIEYDKMILFQETELRKLYGCDKSAYVSVTMRQYSQAYMMLIQMIHDGCGEFLDLDGLDETSSGEDDIYATPASVYSKIDRLRAVSLDALNDYSGGSHSGRSERGKTCRISSPLLAGGLLSIPLRKHSRDSSPLYYIPETDVKGRNSSTSSIGPPIPKPRSKVLSTQPDSMTSSYVKMVDSPADSSESSSVHTLKREVEYLTKELNQAREEIKRLQEREKQLRDRLSDQVQKQFNRSNQHFENLNLGTKRPTELIRQYGNLYTDGRLDALDALDDLKDLEELSILKTKILFSIIVLAFRSAQEMIDSTRSQVYKTLNIPPDIAAHDTLSLDIQQHIDRYLQQTFDRIDVTSSVKNVCEQIYETLFDYPCLRECEGLVQFVDECVQIALGLLIQNPPFVISYSDFEYKRDNHVRFHTSDPGSEIIKNYLWPCLLEGEGGRCVSKGYVVT